MRVCLYCMVVCEYCVRIVARAYAQKMKEAHKLTMSVRACEDSSADAERSVVLRSRKIANVVWLPSGSKNWLIETWYAMNANTSMIRLSATLPKNEWLPCQKKLPIAR